MEVALSEDQEFFRDTTRKFLAAASSPTAVRALARTDDGYDAAYWRQGAELGWTSLLVPEEYGGGSVSGRGVVDLTIVADAFGRAVAPGPLIPTNVVAATIAGSGSDQQRADYLGPIVAGECVAAWCNEVGVRRCGRRRPPRIDRRNVPDRGGSASRRAADHRPRGRRGCAGPRAARHRRTYGHADQQP